MDVITSIAISYIWMQIWHSKENVRVALGGILNI